VVERSSISAVAEESVPSVGDGTFCVFAPGPASGVGAGEAGASATAAGAAAGGGATGGTGTAARRDSEIGGGGLSEAGGVMAFVSCVRNNDEMGSMGALGGIGWTGGGTTGGGTDSRTGEIGSMTGGGAAAGRGAGSGVCSTMGTSCNVALVGRTVVATDVIET